MAKYAVRLWIVDKTDIAVDTEGRHEYPSSDTEDGKVSEVGSIWETDLECKRYPDPFGKEKVIDEPIEVDGKITV